jgi:CO/xanthine dehydrogenase Mo-binding subunit
VIENLLPKSIVDNPVLGTWIAFSQTGRATVSAGKVELGQGIDTALAQIAADELDMAVGLIDVVSADTDHAPDEGFTAGSYSVEISGASVRLAAAQARAALLAAASARLGGASDLACRNGLVLRDGQATALDFWVLAADVDWGQHITGQVPVKRQVDHVAVGTSVPRADIPARLLGGGFIHDRTPAGLLHARVVRQPFRLARLAAVDEAWLARRHPEVRVLRDADFLALLSSDEHRVQLAQGEAERFVRWDDTPGRWTPPKTPGSQVIPAPVGTPASAGRRAFSARYTRGPIAHASIGPSCALAQYADGRLTVWTHSQGVFPLRDALARALGLATDAVRVIHAPGAGCYGHNGADDAALDAAIVALRCPGAPVRVLWSREDELSRGPVGAPMATEIKATLDDEGRIGSWALSVTSAPHSQRPGFGGFLNLVSAEALDPALLPDRIADLPPAAGGGASRNAVAIYDLPAQKVHVTLDASSRVRTSSLRSLGAFLNVFAIEQAMDELAELAGVDPLAFRLRHLADPRCRALLEGAAAMAGWPGAGEAGQGRAMGLGVSRYKGRGAWLAAVAEVSVDEAVRAERLWLCVDAGLIVNPEGARNQIEGGAIQSASWALKEAVPVENDRIPPLDWSSYPIMTFSEVPQIETRFIVDPSQPPLGVGEAAQGPVAAAIGNAASRALGVRLRDLPLTRERLVEMMA